MAWENIEERLKRPFRVEVSFPAGTVWLPDTQTTIDTWLTSIAETDEELRELNIPRIRCSWIDLPVLGFWHEDMPDSITTSQKGTWIMKYKPTYGDKQRDAQKRKKEEKVQNQQPPQEPAQKPEAGQSGSKDNRPGHGDQHAA